MPSPRRASQSRSGRSRPVSVKVDRSTVRRLDGSSTVGLPVVPVDSGTPSCSPGSATSRQGPALRCALRRPDPCGEFGQGLLLQNAADRGPFRRRKWRDTDANAVPQGRVDAAAVVGGDRRDPLDVQNGSVAVWVVAEAQVGALAHLFAESGADVRCGERPRQAARQSAVTGRHELRMPGALVETHVRFSVLRPQPPRRHRSNTYSRRQTSKRYRVLPHADRRTRVPVPLAHRAADGPLPTPGAAGPLPLLPSSESPWPRPHTRPDHVVRVVVSRRRFCRSCISLRF